MEDKSAFDVSEVAGQKKLYVDSDRIDECLAYARSQEISAFAVIPVRGYKLRNLEFLRRHNYIEDLTIVFPASPPFDVSAITSLGSLRSLVVSDPVEIALRQFPDLRVFRGVFGAGLDLSNCAKLELLDLSKYNGGKQRDLSELPPMSALSVLELVQSSLTSLAGIERFPALKQVSLSYLPKLQRLDPLGGLNRLESLHCQNCPRLSDVASLANFTKLRSLRLNSCAEIPTLGFLDQMTELEEFRFVNTSVTDGDLRPLIRLKRVGFLPKKHYSHTPEQLAQLLRLNEPTPPHE